MGSLRRPRMSELCSLMLSIILHHLFYLKMLSLLRLPLDCFQFPEKTFKTSVRHKVPKGFSKKQKLIKYNLASNW